jgi:hypothetical protein
MKKKMCDAGVGSLLSMIVLVGFIAGCGESKKPWEIVYPAKGVITLDGKPLGGALIGFVPENSEVPSSVRPQSTSKEDGSFVVGTYSSADGAPEGSYRVIVTHYPIVGSKDNPTNGPNDLPPKYARAESTDLRLEVKGPSTEFASLDLKKSQ